MSYFFLPFQYFMLLDTLQKSSPEGQKKAPSKTGDFVRLRDFHRHMFRNTVLSNNLRGCDMEKNQLMIPVLPDFPGRRNCGP